MSVTAKGATPIPGPDMGSEPMSSERETALRVAAWRVLGWAEFGGDKYCRWCTLPRPAHERGCPVGELREALATPPEPPTASSEGLPDMETVKAVALAIHAGICGKVGQERAHISGPVRAHRWEAVRAIETLGAQGFVIDRAISDSTTGTAGGEDET